MQVRLPFQRWLLSPLAARAVERLLRSRCHPHTAEAQAPSPLRRVGRSFRQGLIEGRYRVAASGQAARLPCADDVGLHRSVLSAIVSRRHHQSPGWPANRNRTPARGGKESTPVGFGRLGSVACHPGRNVAPPKPSSPGPFVASGCPPALAAYLLRRGVRAKISERVRTRSGRIRLHPDLPSEIAPFND